LAIPRLGPKGVAELHHFSLAKKSYLSASSYQDATNALFVIFTYFYRIELYLDSRFNGYH